MRRFLFSLIFVLVVCCGRTSEARKLALLVGVDDYENAHSLNCCVNDMKTLKKALKKIGFLENDIQILTTGGKYRDLPTKKKIEQKVTEILSMARPEDWVFLAFSGHGAQEGKMVYFCPPDADPDDLEGTCVSITRVMNDLAKCHAKFKWVVVDACRNDPNARDMRGMQVVPSPPTGIALFQSCAKGERSYEEKGSGGNGYFTKNFAEALSGKADANQDGKLTLMEVCTWTTAHTKAEVEEAEKRTQSPYFSGSISDFVLMEDLNIEKAKALAKEAQKAMDAEDYELAIKKFDEALELCPQFTAWKRERDLAQKFLEQKKSPTPRLAGEPMTLMANGIQYTFRWCPSGAFMMGGERREWNGSNWTERSDQHRVVLTRGFWMLETEVTQEMWQSVMGRNPSHFRGARKPVESVSWNDCQEFCRRLSRESGQKIQLPTEAQWEYACRAGTSGNYDENLDSFAWHKDNSGSTTHEVGRKTPNAWGLFDMRGNVWEWCSDYYDVNYYYRSPTNDPENVTPSAHHIHRGGSWYHISWICRAALRDWDSPTYQSNSIGFRVCLIPAQEE